MKTGNIKQSIEINGSKHEVFETLMDSKKHTELTGDKAVIKREVGGKLSLFGGYIEGTTLEIIPDEKIVQASRFEYDDWPKDYFSKVTFRFKEEDGRTRILFWHSGIPANHVKELEQGWIDYYWEPLKKLFSK